MLMHKGLYFVKRNLIHGSIHDSKAPRFYRAQKTACWSVYFANSRPSCLVYSRCIALQLQLSERSSPTAVSYLHFVIKCRLEEYKDTRRSRKLKPTELMHDYNPLERAPALRMRI